MDKCSIRRIFWRGVSWLNYLLRKETPPSICAELETQSLFDNLQFLRYGGSEQSIPGHPDQAEEQERRDYFFRYTAA